MYCDPQAFRNFAKQWRFLIRCYGERKEGRVYVKVDGNFLPISQILFNDEKEHSFQIQCHFQSLQENETIPNDVDDDVLASFKKICSSLVDESSKQWDIIRESYEKHADQGYRLLSSGVRRLQFG